MDEIVSLAAEISGVQESDLLLMELCQAFHDSLERKLRDGVTVADCGKAFPLAVAALAAKARSEGLSGESVSAFSAGSISLSVSQDGDRFTSAAMGLMEPWLKDSGFGFRRV